MNPRLLAVFASLLLASTACKQRVVLYCDEDTPCESPDRPFCDVEGEYPASEGAGNTCIPDPFAGADAGVGVADAAGIAPDAGDGKLDPSWTDVTPAASPSGRYRPAMAYDTERQRLVLFAGHDGENIKEDTWEWDGSAWTDASPASGSPEYRDAHAMAYDGARGHLLLFGGYPTRGDTWEWNGTRWTELASDGQGPPARKGHAMVYDAARQEVLLFGGRVDVNVNDTWAWNGSIWSEVTPETAAPPERQDHAMAYDAARERVVLFGGCDSLTSEYADTWEWDGSSWSEVTPASDSPSARQSHAMAYDPIRQRVVLFGGFNGSMRLNDVWEWDGSSWTEITPSSDSPPARSSHAMAYDSSRNRVVLFGGSGAGGPLGDTWEWDGGGQ